MDKSLRYILNPDKTENMVLTTSINCTTDSHDAYLQMKAVYEQFSSNKFNSPSPLEGKGTVKAIHYIMSFVDKENVTPELAHKIAKAFVRKTFGEDVQAVIATHIDKSHVHNHIILNSYDLSGKKFYDNKASLKNVRESTNSICKVFGVTPALNFEGNGRSMQYNEWEHKRRGTSWKQKIRLKIDGLVLKVKNVDELLAELEMLGYTVKRGKYISVKAPNQQRAVRLKTLGEDYTVESLASRILWKDVGTGLNNPYEKSALREKYSETISGIQKVNAFHPTLEQLGTMLTVISRDNLRSIGEVEGKIRQLEYEIENARQELNTLTAKLDNLKTLVEQAEEYFALMDKAERTPAEKLRLKMYKPILERNNIVNRSDFEYLKSVVADTQKKTAPLKENFERCKHLYKLYSEIAMTYYEISKGDYIARLVEKERKTADAEKRKPGRNNRI